MLVSSLNRDHLNWLSCLMLHASVLQTDIAIWQKNRVLQVLRSCLSSSHRSVNVFYQISDVRETWRGTSVWGQILLAVIE